MSDKCSCCGNIIVGGGSSIRREWKKLGLMFCDSCVLSERAKEFALKYEKEVLEHGNI